MADVRLRPTRESDLAYVTGLERDPENRSLIGQWTDAQHLSAIRGEDGRSHWIIERPGDRAPLGYLIAYDCVAAGAGVYVKRILVGEKERGTGKRALKSFLDQAFAAMGAPFVWLTVYEINLRAQCVYRALGFERFDPPGDRRGLFDQLQAPAAGTFRMRIVRPNGRVTAGASDLPARE